MPCLQGGSALLVCLRCGEAVFRTVVLLLRSCDGHVLLCGSSRDCCFCACLTDCIAGCHPLLDPLLLCFTPRLEYILLRNFGRAQSPQSAGSAGRMNLRSNDKASKR